MNTRIRKYKHLEAFKNTVVPVVSSDERCESQGQMYDIIVSLSMDANIS